MKLFEMQNIMQRMDYYKDKKIIDLSDEDIEDFIRLRKRVREANNLIKETAESYLKMIKENAK